MICFLYSLCPVFWKLINCFAKKKQNGQIQTSQTGGQPYSDTYFILRRVFSAATEIGNYFHRTFSGYEDRKLNKKIAATKTASDDAIASNDDDDVSDVLTSEDKPDAIDAKHDSEISFSNIRWISSFTKLQTSVTRLGDLLDFGKLFKTFGNN